jgi:hypothetical protein
MVLAVPYFADFSGNLSEPSDSPGPLPCCSLDALVDFLALHGDVFRRADADRDLAPLDPREP